MKSGKFLMLALVAAALGAAAIYAYKMQNPTSRPAAAEGLSVGDALVGELTKRAGTIVRIKVAADGQELTFARNDQSDWSVESRGGYPMDGNKINQLVVDLSDVKVADSVTKNPDKYDKFGLKGEVGSKATLSFIDKNGNDIARLIMGNNPKADPDSGGRGGDGRYFRVNDDPHVYLARENLYWVDTGITNWIETEIANVTSNDIVSVKIDHRSTQSLEANWKNDKPKLTELEPGKQEKTSELSGIRSALGNLRLSDVLEAKSDQLSTLTFGATYAAQNKDGTLYTVKTAEANSKYYIALSAGYTSPVFSAADKTSTVTLAAAEKKAEAAKNAVADFNKKHSPWLYEISSWTLEKYKKTRDEVMEDIPQKAENPALENEDPTNALPFMKPEANAGEATIKVAPVQDKATTAPIGAGGGEGKSEKAKGKTE